MEFRVNGQLSTTHTARRRARALTKTGRLGAAMIAGLLLVLCGCLKRPFQSQAQWQMTGNSSYHFADPYIKIDFRIEDGRTFHWYFKNLARSELIIDSAKTALRCSGDPKDYALWGEAMDGVTPLQPLILKPGTFLSFSYPIRFTSPFVPFIPPPEQSFALILRARWGLSEYQYELVFPTSNEGNGP